MKCTRESLLTNLSLEPGATCTDCVLTPDEVMVMVTAGLVDGLVGDELELPHPTPNNAVKTSDCRSQEVTDVTLVCTFDRAGPMEV